MRYLNARQSIHDAFAIQVSTPERYGVGGGTKYDSTRQLANGLRAGLIIKAVLDQPVALRSTAMFLNGPDSTTSDEEIVAMKSVLCTSYIHKNNATSYTMGKVMSVVDILIMSYKTLIWNPESHSSDIARAVSMISNNREETRIMGSECNKLIDRLVEMDNKSLQPVWEVIDDTRDAEHAEAN